MNKYSLNGQIVFASSKDEAMEILAAVAMKNVRKFLPSLSEDDAERIADYINDFKDSKVAKAYEKCLDCSKVFENFGKEVNDTLDALDDLHPNVRMAASANAEEITASLIWGVEGVEKLPKYGDVLFYVVNGTRYGVKPCRGSKHDIDWYYHQLKAGMEADKGYSVGLTNYLNTWIRKKELDIVFKGKA